MFCCVGKCCRNGSYSYTTNDINRNSSSSSTVAFFKAPNVKVSDQFNMSKYSLHMQNYLKSFSDKANFSEQLDVLELAPEDEALLDDCRDPITDKIMNIPVTLNERAYDLSTLEKLTQDPFSNEKFDSREIQSCRKIATVLSELIQKYENKNPKVASFY